MLATAMRRFSASIKAACALVLGPAGLITGAATPGDAPARFAYTAPEYNPPRLRTRPRATGEDKVSRSMAETDRLAGERKWGEAVRIVNTLLEKYPDDTDLLSRAGHYYMMMRAYAISEGYWSRLAELHPNNAWALACRGGILVRLGQREQAQDLLQKAHTLNRREIVARFHLACLSFAVNDPEKARENLGSMNLLEIGNCATWIRDDAEALEALMGSDHLRQLCGMVLGGGEAKPAGTVNVAGMDAAALRATMDRAASDLWSSYQAIQRKDWQAAETNLSAAVEHGITAPAATQGLAYCRVMQNDATKAFDMMKGLAEAYPDSAFVQFKFGLLCMDLERYETAEDAFARAHQINPDDFEITVHLAGARAAMSRADDAWSLLDGIPAAARPAWAAWFNQPRPYARALKQDPRFPVWVTKLED
ncbi:MAG: tetratricopeptide repeat protein [bacterium]